MTDRKHMIEVDEALMVIDQYNGKRFIRETGSFGEFGDYYLVSHYVTDRTVEIRRINTVAWEHAEDITDECAHHWLMEADAQYALNYDDIGQCESIMPLYVKNSKAWARWMDDQQAEKPVNVSAMYGTYSAVNGHVA